MKKLLDMFRLPITVIIALALSGCLLISGTFVIVDDFSFTTGTGFYYYYVDLTEEDDWKDHKDDIDIINVVGFEMIFNNPGDEVTFEAYIDKSETQDYDTYSELTAGTSTAVKVLGPITLPNGESKITYGNSFQYLHNVDALKKLVKSGKLSFYGVSSTVSNFTVTKGKVIVTFTAHGS